MVVIEPANEESPPPQHQINHKNLDSEPETSSAINNNNNKDVSEGFETASEGDHSDRGTDFGDDDNNGDDEQQHNQQGDGEEEQSAPLMAAKDDSYEDALDDDQLKQRALAQANDAKVEGNTLFKDGQFEDALLKYESALQVAPEMPESVELRSICHSNRGICYLKLGKYDETVKECSKAIELNPTYVKALLRRGEAYEKLERYEEAISDMKKIMEVEPSNDQARRNIVRLEPLAREKMEKMKEEMIGKLKDVGNNILGRFGMSVDNFKAVKDPNTGSYSISFQR
ncbi:tetratricopeptide repeat protein 1-like [Chenopodium quinoa]|uniref:tetratricopeptide repeat protein 1-like n=1 Tax=Chenopodium quinoa TaxID=63459 RepID=UPI000B794386|nr:tetratricopeptide repeat protein 1-like [Chenopodium quinoa]